MEKLARALPVSAGTVPESTTALGDWYVNRLVVDRRPLLREPFAHQYIERAAAYRFSAPEPRARPRFWTRSS